MDWGAHALRRAPDDRTAAPVTALGDEVNEAARIEACATGGRALASKALIERLDPGSARALGIDPARLRYIAARRAADGLGEGAPRRPALAVCEV